MTRLNAGAITVLLGCTWTAVAVSQEFAPSGRLLTEITRKCSQVELTVWGETEDLRLTPGQTGWTIVADSTIELFCGKYDEDVECPEQTDFIWVSRTEEWEVFIACYESD